MVKGRLFRKVVLTGIVAGALAWSYTPTRRQIKSRFLRFQADLEERETELTQALLSEEPA